MTTWTVALKAPLSRGFPRQEYCSGLPFSSLNPHLLHWKADSLPLNLQGSPYKCRGFKKNKNKNKKLSILEQGKTPVAVE